MEKILYDDIIARDVKLAFRGIVVSIPINNVSENNCENFVVVDDVYWNSNFGDELEIVRHPKPVKFYSPYAPVIQSVEVVGEIRPIGFTPPENTILFGYSRPKLATVHYMGRHVQNDNSLSRYKGKWYKVYGNVDWDTPVLPLTPVDYVRLEGEGQLVSHDGHYYEVAGDMVDNRFGAAIEGIEVPDYAVRQ